MPTEKELREKLLEKAMLPRSLGAMEDLAVRLGSVGAFDLERPELLLFCADHGVTREGVTHSAKEISFQMARSFAHGEGVSGLFCRLNHIPLSVIDVGLDTVVTDKCIIDRKISRGTRDFLDGDAMTDEACTLAMDAGARMVETVRDRGCDIVLFGEMGVGNSTSASAILSRSLHVPVREVTGSASGLGEAELDHKREVVEKGLMLHPEKDGFGLLRAFGGYETAAMAGGMIAAAHAGIPVLLDGLLTYAAALCAVDMDVMVSKYLVAGHRSAAPGSSQALLALGLSPVLDLGMQLGEGSGAAVAWPVVRLASHMIHGLKAFGELDVKNSTRDLQCLGLL
ncbi:MAG: nicotinate-nucleotide--dimethylbenzimidazole phosphoribosyltransferase [Sphaerochaetaceae bacterium]